MISVIWRHGCGLTDDSLFDMCIRNFNCAEHASREKALPHTPTVAPHSLPVRSAALRRCALDLLPSLRGRFVPQVTMAPCRVLRTTAGIVYSE